jgi:hypothetical protein
MSPRLQWCRATRYVEGVQALKDKPVECAARQFVKFACAMEKALECMPQAGDLLVLGLLSWRFRQVKRAAQLAHNQKKVALSQARKVSLADASPTEDAGPLIVQPVRRGSS